MQPQLQRIEVESGGTDDHDLAIDHAAARQLLEQSVVQFREITVERTQIATLNERVVLATKDDGAKSIPFRLEQKCPGRGKLVRQLREHGLDGRRDREVARWRRRGFWILRLSSSRGGHLR